MPQYLALEIVVGSASQPLVEVAEVADHLERQGATARVLYHSVTGKTHWQNFERVDSEAIAVSLDSLPIGQQVAIEEPLRLGLPIASKLQLEAIVLYHFALSQAMSAATAV
jgi:hypothetical protein